MTLDDEGESYVDPDLHAYAEGDEQLHQRAHDTFSDAKHTEAIAGASQIHPDAQSQV